MKEREGERKRHREIEKDIKRRREGRLKGCFQGQQTRGERGKKTLPAFAARLLNQQTRGDRGECLNKHIRTKNIFKIYVENFNFLYFFFLLTITIHI